MQVLKQIIRRELLQEELLAQLAEEAVELAHAALKLRRTLSTENPTPVTNLEARRNLEEEVADVLLLLDLVDIPQDRQSTWRIQGMKLERWVKRLYNREEDPRSEEDKRTTARRAHLPEG